MMRNAMQSRAAKLFIVLIIAISMIIFWYSLPRQLFSDPASTVLLSRDGRLMSAVIADDTQWRFPLMQEVPEKFKTCICQFEDQYFYYHPGVNPLAVGRAAYQNIEAGKRVSGASTLSMQVIRMSRKGRKRNIRQKIIETFLALRLEMSADKDEILALYAANAPFGGNVVGLEAAAWRYYGRPAKRLSWGETATLAVLPNAPSLIYPGKNKDELLAKRNRLLKQLLLHNHLDSSDYQLALLEPLPGAPHPLPQYAMHLLSRLISEGKKGTRIKSTLDYDLQKQVSEIASHHYQRLSANGIRNLSVLILENRENRVAAYIGNVIDNQSHHGSMVDIITAPRSTGSILKPFLYAGMLEDGLLLPDALIRDVPAVYGNYRPENFNKQFSGAIPASDALSRSLNVPAVHMLNEYGVSKLYHSLEHAGLSTLKYPADYYGLSLILGGAEATLWDLTNAYSLMVKSLLFTNDDNISEEKILQSSEYYYGQKSRLLNTSTPYHPGTVWHTLKAIQKTNRPGSHAGWQNFYSSPTVAWKTGTSHGNRDAWAIGVTPDYTIGIWAGNADGEGRPGLTGIKAAAPVLFHIFDLIKPKNWFPKPVDNLINIQICSKSGYKASPLCPGTRSVSAPVNGTRSPLCPYHQIIHLDSTGKFRVNSSCESLENIKSEVWFVLPTLMEQYYKSRDPFYKSLPPYKENCENQDEDVLQIIYPEDYAQIFLPRDISSETKKVVFKAVHRDSEAEIYWFIDNEFVCKTKDFHEISVVPRKGRHILNITDNNGISVSRHFTIRKK